MKKLIVGFAALGLYASSACSQSSVTLYGVVDEAIRYDNHQTPTGGHNVTMGTGGALYGTRWGLRGVEDLGDGLKTVFTLESGFVPNTGASNLSTPNGQVRLFGRQAFVGLSKPVWGSLTFGRQYDLAYLTAVTHDMFGFANYAATWGFQAFLLGPVRLDNTVMYSSDNFYGFNVKGAYTIGGVAGDTHRNSSPALALNYDNGSFSVGAVYQIFNNIGGTTPANTAYGSTYYGITIPDSSQKTFALGATWVVSNATLMAQYIYSHVYPADYRNDSFSLGFAWRFTPSVDLKTAVYADFLHHAGEEGTRITAGPVLIYHLSKRTDVYTGFNYNHLTGAWTRLASTTGFTQSFNGYNSMFEGVVGMVHRF
ncbi:porin [Paraburkholderia phenoliruptrix]|uniref:porin n=1 Tax=Paraburkholderia phenoliruptrix TaxID=252970 RepID=UPI0034CD3F0E